MKNTISSMILFSISTFSIADVYNVVIVPNMENITKIQAGGNFAYAIKDNQLYAVGGNNQGQLGKGDFTNINSWSIVSEMEGITDIEAGGYHGYAIKDNELYSVGFNSSGQLGRESNVRQSTWGIVSGMSGVTALLGLNDFIDRNILTALDTATVIND